MVKINVSNEYWVEDMFIINGKLCLITIDFETGYRTLHINVDTSIDIDDIINNLSIDASLYKHAESPVLKGCSVANTPWFLFEFSANDSVNEFTAVREIINREKLKIDKTFVDRLDRLIESQRRYDYKYSYVKFVSHPIPVIKALAGKIIELIDEFTTF